MSGAGSAPGFTTAGSPVLAPFRANRTVQALVAATVLWWGLLAIDPVFRFDWFLENLLVVAGAALLVAIARGPGLSDLSWALVLGFLWLHLLGAHYTYSLTPPGFWLQAAFDLDRNPWDRVIHFSFGLLLAYPLREWLMRGAGLGGGWLYAMTFTLSLAASSAYEMIEWMVAMVVDPEAAMAFLGTQGDVFDAQKDTGLACIGAILCLTLVALLPPLRRRGLAGD